MIVNVSSEALRETKWHEYALRFLFGGLVTVIAGLIAKEFGPQIGGLFLAFPAIFPASATLIEKHEKQKKQQNGLNGTNRSREAAGVDAAGAAMGSIGLLIFAVIIWRFLPHASAWLVLVGATLSWLVSAVAIWLLRKKT
jgi:uncharacterized membrane protein (GlpM family)